MDQDRNTYYDEEAEQSVLGAILEEPRVLPGVRQILRAVDFYNTAHQIIYAAIEAIADGPEGGAIDSLTVADRIVKQNDAGRIGGTVYLYDLVEAVPEVQNVEHYAGIVKEHSGRRVLYNAGKEACQASRDPNTDPAVARAHFNERIDEAQVTKQDYHANAREAVRAQREQFEARKEQGETPFLSTGVPTIDRLVRLMQGRWGAWGGVPGAGKSSLMRLLARNWARMGKKGLLHTTEMPREDVMASMIAAEAGVPIEFVIDPTMRTNQHESQIVEAEAILSSLEENLIINDQPGITPLQLVNSARLARMELGKLDFIILDQMNSMLADERSRDARAETDINVNQQVVITRETGANFSCVSQLNRRWAAITQPSMDLFKESGGIEQNAWWAIILWHSSVKRISTFIEGERVVELWAVKQKMGPTGYAPIVFHGPTYRFRELTPDERTEYWELKRSGNQITQVNGEDVDDEIPY